MSKSLYDWCIENERQDILDLWDYILNKVSPKDVSYGSAEKYYFKCPRRLHDSKLVSPHHITNGLISFCYECESFGQWCLDNDKKWWLDLWDYKLNTCSPFEVSKCSGKKYWFKCHKEIHDSEQKSLRDLAGKGYNLKCDQCNSIGQYLIDTYGENALELHWDYKKNKVNPFKTPKSCAKKVWLFCLEKTHHGSYEIRCNDFYNGKRCPYCASKKIHPKDSFAQYHIDNTDTNFLEKYWSKKNVVDPFVIAPNYSGKVWFICVNDEEHEDYEMTCNNFTHGQRCKECKESKGERKIKKYLNHCKINFIPQKEFSNLVGTSEWKPLSYDFYLPDYNLLIEYQGEYHDGTVPNQSEEDFLKQQEHDRRKREYAESHNIRLLKIWYWDFDNIETILNENIK